MVIVIQEYDYSDKEEIVIGVASDRENAIRIIDEYYGKNAVQSDFRDIRDSGLNFDVKIKVDGCNYGVTGIEFEIDEI